MDVDNRSWLVNNVHMPTTETREPFMSLLRRHRLAAGLTQTALAKKLKVVPSTVSFWESGSSIPNPAMIPLLARILGIDAMTLTRVIEPELAVGAAK